MLNSCNCFKSVLTSTKFLFYLNLLAEYNCTDADVPENLQCYESTTEPSGFYFDCIDECDPNNRLHCGATVCGSDFGTYPGKCEMSKYGCETYGKENITSLTVTGYEKCQGKVFSSIVFRKKYSKTPKPVQPTWFLP